MDRGAPPCTPTPTPSPTPTSTPTPSPTPRPWTTLFFGRSAGLLHQAPPWRPRRGLRERSLAGAGGGGGSCCCNRKAAAACAATLAQYWGQVNPNCLRRRSCSAPLLSIAVTSQGAWAWELRSVPELRFFKPLKLISFQKLKRKQSRSSKF